MTHDASEPRKICFMIMPFGRKKTGLRAGKGPTEVDFDALWDKVYCPLFEEDLGFEAVRADQDVGALIIHEMIERLALSDVVVADISIPNANVYYEVGVRHAAHKAGCVLVAADWAKPLFDIAQMRHLRFSLPDGNVSDETAAAARKKLKESIPELMRGESPLFTILPGYPGNTDPAKAQTFHKRVNELNAFAAKVRAARRAPKGDRRAAALQVRDQYLAAARDLPSVAMELVLLLRDTEAWAEIDELIKTLPAETRAQGVIQEQLLLARSKTGSHLEAVGALEELIATSGDSSERSGLIGGRYRKLWADAKDPDDKASYLDRAIEAYERGMLLDLNDYYPSSNLPRLLRRRANAGDEARAHAAAHVAAMACERALQLNPDDPFLRPTLLGAAFDAGDVARATQLADELRTQGVAAFPLRTTTVTLKESLDLQKDPDTVVRLTDILEALQRLLPPEQAN